MRGRLLHRLIAMVSNLVDQFVDDDGKLHVHVKEHVVFHFHGNREQIIHGNDVELSKEKVIVTGGAFHINPLMSERMNDIVTNQLIHTVIAEKTRTLYDRNRRIDYKQIAHNKKFNRRLTNGCKSKCGCK